MSLGRYERTLDGKRLGSEIGIRDVSILGNYYGLGIGNFGGTSYGKRPGYEFGI